MRRMLRYCQYEKKKNSIQGKQGRGRFRGGKTRSAGLDSSHQSHNAKRTAHYNPSSTKVTVLDQVATPGRGGSILIPIIQTSNGNEH